jgi:hypothetical protein
VLKVRCTKVKVMRKVMFYADKVKCDASVKCDVKCKVMYSVR